MDNLGVEELENRLASVGVDEEKRRLSTVTAALHALIDKVSTGPGDLLLMCAGVLFPLISISAAYLNKIIDLARPSREEAVLLERAARERIEEMDGTALQTTAPIPDNYKPHVLLPVDEEGNPSRGTIPTSYKETKGCFKYLDILKAELPQYEEETEKAAASGKRPDYRHIYESVGNKMKKAYGGVDASGNQELRPMMYIACRWGSDPRDWPKNPAKNEVKWPLCGVNERNARNDHICQKLKTMSAKAKEMKTWTVVRSENGDELYSYPPECTRCIEADRTHGHETISKEDMKWSKDTQDAAIISSNNPSNYTLKRSDVESLVNETDKTKELFDLMDCVIRDSGEPMTLSGSEEDNLHTPEQIQSGVPMYLLKNIKPLYLPVLQNGDLRQFNNTRHSVREFKDLPEIDMEQVYEIHRPGDGAKIAVSPQTCKRALSSSPHDPQSDPGDWETTHEFRFFLWSILWYIFLPITFLFYRFPIGIVRHYPSGVWHEVHFKGDFGIKTRCWTLGKLSFCLIVILIKILLMMIFNGIRGIRLAVNPRADRMYAFVNPHGTNKILLYPVKFRNKIGSFLSLDLVYVIGANLFGKTKRSRDTVSFVSKEALVRIRAGEEQAKVLDEDRRKNKRKNVFFTTAESNEENKESEDEDAELIEYDSDDDEDCV